MEAPMSSLCGKACLPRGPPGCVLSLCLKFVPGRALPQITRCVCNSHTTSCRSESTELGMSNHRERRSGQKLVRVSGRQYSMNEREKTPRSYLKRSAFKGWSVCKPLAGCRSRACHKVNADTKKEQHQQQIGETGKLRLTWQEMMLGKEKQEQMPPRLLSAQAPIRSLR